MNKEKMFIHDLRNDLNLIKFLVLKSGIKDDKTKAIHEIIGSVANKCSIFLDAITIDNDPINIGQAIDEILNRFPQIIFERHYLNELHSNINKAIFQDVVTNLIINAIEAGAGTIDVKINSDSLVISDNGNCTKEIVAKLNNFMVFTTKLNGSGLGTQCVKKFCEMFNLKVHYEIIETKEDLNFKHSLKITIKF